METLPFVLAALAAFVTVRVLMLVASSGDRRQALASAGDRCAAEPVLAVARPSVPVAAPAQHPAPVGPAALPAGLIPAQRSGTRRHQLADAHHHGDAQVRASA